MEVLNTVEQVRQACAAQKKNGKTIGLVPTMGALHDGHASLIETASRENDFVIVSVFVNPTQFAPNEDLSAYPRTLEADCLLAGQMGAHAVFAPTPKAMYPFGEGATWVEVTGCIADILCGRSRPTHFRGVTTVVNKLFNLVQPDRAYFGQKDAQQAQIINRMVQDMFIPVELRIMPIIREQDGLALSSRNIYLSPEQRRAALVLSQSLNKAEQLVAAGEKNADKVLAAIKDMIRREPLAAIDYAEIYSFPTLELIEGEMQGQVFIALAVKMGTTRLIDNIVIEVR